jgi:hypothetical protein
MDMLRLPKELNRITTLRIPGILSYFIRFMREAPLISRVVVILYFTMFLINPLYARPEGAGGDAIVTGIGLGTLDLILILAALAIFHFNQRLYGQERREGVFILLTIISPIILALLALLTGAITGEVLGSLLRASSSALILVPFILMVMILLESVIRYTDQEGEPTLLIALAFISIFLAMYTFATIYYLNSLVVGPGGPPGFYDVFYFSGVTFTTVGYGDLAPTGPGKLLAVIESMMGWVIMSLITAIFIRILTSSRK